MNERTCPIAARTTLRDAYRTNRDGAAGRQAVQGEEPTACTPDSAFDAHVLFGSLSTGKVTMKAVASMKLALSNPPSTRRGLIGDWKALRH
jgi:hypothetical protein